MLLDRDDSLVVFIDIQEKLTPLVIDSQSFVERCEWVLRLAQAMNVPILASEHYPKGLGQILANLSPYLQNTNCIEKIHFSCMQESTYLQRLRDFNKNQMVLIGIEAHVCVLQSALEMKDQGFEVFVVVDAVSSRKELDLEYGLKRMKQNGVHLITSEMVFFEWLRLAGTPEFKSLSKEFLSVK